MFYPNRIGQQYPTLCETKNQKAEMIYNLKILIPRVFIKTSLFLLIFSISITVKSQERLVNYAPVYNVKDAKEVVEITNIEIKKSAVTFGKPFIADGDWLNGLTVKVKNISSKPIAFIRLFLVFSETKDAQTDSTIGWLIDYGQKQKQFGSVKNLRLVNPQESASLVLRKDRYKELQEWVKSKIQAKNINKVSIRMGEVIFADDTKWYAGQFFRRDSENADRWILLPQTFKNVNEYFNLKNAP
jgi:hypothetical protein